MGWSGGTCAYCGQSIPMGEVKYTRPRPDARIPDGDSTNAWKYCSKACYDNGKVDYDRAKKNSGGSSSGSSSVQGDLWNFVMTWILTKVLPFVAPYLGWSAVVALPFTTKYSFSNFPIWALIFSLVLGTGIGITIKFVPLPRKIQKFRKFFLWLPVIVIAVIAAIIIARNFL